MAGLRTQSAPAVDRALTLLESLANAQRGISLSHVVKKLGLPRSSAYCLLLTLERRGYLAYNAQTRRYMFGLKLFSLAKMALAGLEIKEVAHPLLRSLTEATRLTVHMAILEQYEAVLVDKIEPPGFLKLATYPGMRMDVHCTAVGRALIAHWPEDALRALVKVRGLPRYNEHTIGSIKKLTEELARTRERGFSIEIEECEIGYCGIGSWIADQDGKVVAAMSLAGTTAQITRENTSLLARKVRQTAASISRLLGFDSTRMKL